MSRVGKTPIQIPSGVEISVSGSSVKVKGTKGELEHTLPEHISAKVEDSILNVHRSNEETQTLALHGLTRALINNMVVGVNEGFRKDLEIVGVGYRAKAKGKDKLELALGFSHPVHVEAPDGITFEVPEPTKISVLGVNKEIVGQVAAEIRSYRKPEPYKGKGVRYAGEHILRKAGKAGK